VSFFDKRMTKQLQAELISIIIINWNGKKWLKNCLNSLDGQTYKNFEIIFVDNASTDDSVEYVRENFPKVKIVQNKKNLGFAGGNNIGLKHAKGDYILLLNNDTWVEKNFLSKFIKSFDEIPNLGSVQSKIALMNTPKKLDAVGSYWTDSSFLYYYGYGKDASLTKYNKPMPFFSNKGASMLIRRDLINKIGLFDDDFWCYYEETDFCHRAWIAGYECWYYPKAVAYHAVGGTSFQLDNAYIQFHNFKNKMLSFVKNFEARTLAYVLPVFLLLNIALSFLWLFQGKIKHFFALYRAFWWNIINIKSTLEKRSMMKKNKVRSDSEIFLKIKKNPKLGYYYYLFVGLEKYEDK
jgi:GT2 family glycosyltransferase